MEQGSTNRSTPGAGLFVSVIPPILGDSQSTSEAAQRDLDAALLLLVNRAQYITGATGAAIALRRNGSKDMLCRASIGANAPELGALLSTEFGLSGESVRTRQALRCDDTARDARVNAEICRQLGIASVIVMPVIDEDQVLGVFELFSEKANAFGDRDLSVVQRLSAMVETAVCLAEAAGSLPKPKKAKAAAAGLVSNGVQQGQFVADLSQKDLTTFATETAEDSIREVSVESEAAAVPTAQSVPELEASSPATDAGAVKKPLLWSAPHEDEEAAGVPDTNQALIPPVLRDLRKCVACGFPVSAGRMLCVECEEKKWRGQLRSQSNRLAVSSSPVAVAKNSGAAAAPAMAKTPVLAEGPKAASAAVTTRLTPALKNEIPISPRVVPTSEQKQQVPAQLSEAASASASEFTLSSALEPSQSWFAANKYVLIVLLAIAAAASVIYFLR